MNNELNDNQLENLLRGISPAAASAALTRRVDEELKLDMSWLSTSSRKQPQRTPRWLTSVGWATMGAAAAIAIMSYLPQPQTAQAFAMATAPAAVEAAVMLPASGTISEWNDVKNDNIQYASHRISPEKRAIVISRELQTWVDPRYGPQMTMAASSHHELLQPVSYQ